MSRKILNTKCFIGVVYINWSCFLIAVVVQSEAGVFTRCTTNKDYLQMRQTEYTFLPCGNRLVCIRD